MGTWPRKHSVVRGGYEVLGGGYTGDCCVGDEDEELGGKLREPRFARVVRIVPFPTMFLADFVVLLALKLCT